LDVGRVNRKGERKMALEDWEKKLIEAIPPDVLQLMPESERTEENLKWLGVTGGGGRGGTWTEEKKMSMKDRLKNLYHKVTDPVNPKDQGGEPDLTNPLDNPLIPASPDDILKAQRERNAASIRAELAGRPPVERDPGPDLTKRENNPLIPEDQNRLVPDPPDLSAEQAARWAALTPQERGQILAGIPFHAPGFGYLKPEDFGLKSRPHYG